MEIFAEFDVVGFGILPRKQGDRSAPEQGKIRQLIGVARARTILAHDRISAPMIANLHSCPMSADEFVPLGRRAAFGGLAGDIVARFLAAFTAALPVAAAAQGDYRSGEGEVRFARLDGPSLYPALLYAPSVEPCFEKKGEPASAWDLASLSSLGWLPLTCRR